MSSETVDAIRLAVEAAADDRTAVKRTRHAKLVVT
jgi:hypothetical protein